MTTKVLKVGAVKTGSKLCSRVTKESVSSMGRLPCLGDLLSPRRPRQDAKKSRGSRPVFLFSNPSSKCAKRELRGGGGGDVTSLPDAGVGNHPGLPGPMAPQWLQWLEARRVGFMLDCSVLPRGLR